MQSKAQRAPAFSLLRFISQVRVSDTLLVVSMLEMVYDVAAFVVLKGFILVTVGAMGPFQPGFGLFWVLGRMGGL